MILETLYSILIYLILKQRIINKLMNNTKGNEGKIKKVLSFQDLSST